MKLSWAFVGLVVSLMALAACGGESTPTHSDCANLTGDGLSPVPCPSVTDVPSKDPVVTVPNEPTVSQVCPDDNSPAALGCQLFLNVPESVGAQALWCYQCHLIEGLSTGIVGPELTDIGTYAAARKDGLTAKQYIRESIKNPEVFIPEGVERALPGLMTEAIVVGMTNDEVDKLVAFMLTLK